MEIFSLAFHGKAGFPYQTVISLPIKKRKLFIQLMSKSYQQQKKQMQEASSGKSSDNSRQITTDDTQMIKKMYQRKQI